MRVAPEVVALRVISFLVLVPSSCLPPLVPPLPRLEKTVCFSVRLTVSSDTLNYGKVVVFSPRDYLNIGSFRRTVVSKARLNIGSTIAM